MSQTTPTPLVTIDAEKLAAMRELAYGASHEINNPLANIAARAQTLLRDECDPERRRALESIHQQALRAHEMISDLMLFARPPQPHFAPVNVAAIVRQVADGLRRSCQPRGVRLDLDVPTSEAVVSGDLDQLADAVRAVMLNALEAVGIDGRISATVRLDGAGGDEGRIVCIEVADDGPGLSDREARHAFDPFFSGREAGRGLGFGLSKCWRIVTAHGGEVRLAPGDGGGAVATITLPAQT